MAIIVPPPPGAAPPPPPAASPVTASPYYVRDQQDWVVAQEQQRHAQALYMVGEYAMFTLMWHVEDYEHGLVARCSRCYAPSDDRAAKVAAAYQQPIQAKCPECFGTTFEGGIKAQIVRPAIFSDTDERETKDRRGTVYPSDVSIETTFDFRVRDGDYAFRLDNTRWQLATPARTTVRSGFGWPGQASEGISYNIARASLEDPEASVAYLIPPTADDLSTILSRGQYQPENFAPYETINAPLIPSWGR